MLGILLVIAPRLPNNAGMRHSLLLRLLLLSLSVSLPAQTPAPEAQPKRFAMPLADVLKAALDKSSLTIPGSHPFHVKLAISDVLHPDSGLQAEIEEYWSSPTLWKRTVTGPGLRQVITRNETGEHFETTGDYFPQWLANFVIVVMINRMDPRNIATWTALIPTSDKVEICWRLNVPGWKAALVRALKGSRDS